MFKKVLIEDGELRIVSNRYLGTLLALFCAFGFLALGVFFAQDILLNGPAHNEFSELSAMAAGFGFLFIGIGLMVIIAIPIQFIKSAAHGGYLQLKAQPGKLTIAVSSPQDYDWKDIEKIIFAKRLLHRDNEGSGYTRHNVVVFFNKNYQPAQTTLPKLQQDTRQAPGGQYHSITQYPGKDLHYIISELRQIAPGKVNILYYDKVTIDYIEGTMSFD